MSNPPMLVLLRGSASDRSARSPDFARLGIQSVFGRAAICDLWARYCEQRRLNSVPHLGRRDTYKIILAQPFN